MSFKSKPLLLVLQLNQTLMYIKNLKSKLKDFNSDAYKFNYDFQANNYGVVFRNGRPQLLQYLFTTDKQNIDVAVWTNLDSTLGQLVCQKYFGRYYRDLLFVLPTNRGLYTNTNGTIQPQHGIKIPKDLNGIYSKFAGYNATNTIVLTTQPNALPQHAKNDMILPQFSPNNQSFQQDVGCIAVTKYLKGLTGKLKSQSLVDVRIMNNGKPLDMLLSRLSNRVFNDSKYL